ncbi:BTBD3_6 [Mytilus edulis]|uniref:BTBD3_6 n=1 Tax=Mytilus edulis TaxID=6550 RepID=A0A8S3SEA5_MYTED|nr:BTBD3_6 [Mytilus edulis]
MCDVTFNVGADKSPIKAHKYMLASASPVFYSMFEGPLSEKGDVDIADITPEYFSMMLQYIYTDKIVIDAKNIKGLLYGSEKYMLPTLKDKCNEFLTSSLNKDHACVVFQTAHDFHMKDLETDALNYIFKKGRACFESDDLLHLSSDCLKLIVESDKLYCDETTIYQRMVQWSKLRCEEQSMSMTDENQYNVLHQNIEWNIPIHTSSLRSYNIDVTIHTDVTTCTTSVSVRIGGVSY